LTNFSYVVRLFSSVPAACKEINKEPRYFNCRCHDGCWAHGVQPRCVRSRSGSFTGIGGWGALPRQTRGRNQVCQ